MLDSPAIEEHQQGRQDGEAGEAHSSTPQPAIQPSSATAWKSASMAAKNARASVHGRRQIADGNMRGRVQQRRPHVHPLPPGLFVRITHSTP